MLPWRIRHAARPAGFVSPRERTLALAATSDVVPFNRVQARAARALLESKSISPHAHTLLRCDYSNVERARAEQGPSFKHDEGFSLTYLPFVAAAVCRALAVHPLVNATVDGDVLRIARTINLGIAVDLGGSGLVVPAVKDAGGLTVRGLARAINDLATRARARKLVPDDLAGGTFTITNPGGYGTFQSFPIINQPQVAILCTDGVRKEVVVGTGDGVAICLIGNLSLSFDHRVLDAPAAARFVGGVRELLEGTDWAATL